MFKAESYVGYKLCWPGDLVINSLWAWSRGLGISQYHGIVSSAYGVYRLRSSFADYTNYIHELVRSRPFQWELQVRSKGIWISRLQLTDAAFLGAPFPVPPPEEQRAIVKFLQHTDGLIHAYVRAKKELIALLTEQKHSVVDHVITRGLTKSSELRFSGIECIGDVPRHWHVRRLRSLVKMHVSNVDKHVREGETPVRLCNYVDVYKHERIRATMDFMKATATPEEIDRFRIHRGDVVITKDSELWNDIGVPALVESAAEDLVCGYHLALLRPKPNLIDSRFLLRALQSPSIAYQFHVRATGVTRFGLSHYAIKSLLLPVPPMREQSEIAKHLDEATSAATAAIERAQREITLLHEYRASLVAAVVTGKLDVREAARALPDVQQLEQSEELGEPDSDLEADEADSVDEEALV